MPAYQNVFVPFSLAPGETALFFGVPNSSAAITASPNGLVRTAGVVTATTAAHNFVPGSRVQILGSKSVLFPAGSDTNYIYGFDGEYTIATVPSTTTFTYNDIGKPNDTGGGGVAVSIAAETVVLNEQSSQLCLPSSLAAPAAAGIIVALSFTAAPGSGSIKVQEAMDDVAFDYVNPTNVAYTIALGAATYYETDLIPFGSRFVNLLVATAPGAGKVVAKCLRVQ
jgi:hypothetical protein